MSEKSPQVTADDESSMIVREGMPNAGELYRASYGESRL